jgi:hypothetical protein
MVELSLPSISDCAPPVTRAKTCSGVARAALNSAVWATGTSKRWKLW